MERLREIEAEFERIYALEKKTREDKLALRDRAREAGLTLDFINHKIITDE